MSLVAFLSAVAGWFAAFAEAGDERAGTHIADLGEGGLELVALEAEGVEIDRRGHVSPDSIIRCQTHNPHPSLRQDLGPKHFGDVHPGRAASLHEPMIDDINN